MARALVIGYGNPLRGDDGVGWEVARRLRRVAGLECEILTVHQLTPDLAEPVSKADRVIFLDAAHGGQPGSWKCEGVSAGAEPAALGHHFTPGGVLGCAKALFSASPRALLISVAAGSFECGEALSPAVAAAVPDIAHRVEMECAKIGE